MNLLHQIEHLETAPLLGTSRLDALKQVDSLLQRIDPEEAPELVLRILIIRFKSLPRSTDTLHQLSTAETWASAENLDALAAHIQLLWCASVAASHPEAIDEGLFSRAISNAKSRPELAVESLIARAAYESDERDTLLRTAIGKMTEPRFASLKLQAWLDLAACLSEGADTLGAEQALLEAIAISTEFDDGPAQIEAHTRLGLHYIHRGLSQKATPYLETALQRCVTEEDDLGAVVNGTILCSIYLETGHQKAAAKTADILLIAGAKRGNWFAVIDAHITHSSILLHTDPQAAILQLVRAAMHLRDLVPAAAVNLLKGRLAELRHQLGANQFDELYQAAMKADTIRS
jgi:hypothetical protein